MLTLPNGQNVSEQKFVARIKAKASREAAGLEYGNEAAAVALRSCVAAARLLEAGDIVNGLGEAAVAGAFAERAGAIFGGGDG